MDSLKEIVRDKIDLREYIGQYGKLNKQGFTFCPIHKETLPSLKVYDSKSWFCFGCQKGGDVFDFAMAMDNLDFKTAMLKLAHYAGVDLFSYKPTTAKNDKANKVLELMFKVKEWKKIIALTNEQVLLACQMMNSKLKELYDTPWQDVDHKHYTDILIKEQEFEDYSEQADVVLNLMKKELVKWETKLQEVKREK